MDGLFNSQACRDQRFVYSCDDLLELLVQLKTLESVSVLRQSWKQLHTN